MSDVRLVLTPGEPAGIGMDLAVLLAQQPPDCDLVCVADPAVLAERARLLHLPLEIRAYNLGAACCRTPGVLHVAAFQVREPVVPGQLQTENAAYVLDTLTYAAEGCLGGSFDAVITGPVQKSVINEAGVPFSGHTEFFCERSGVDHVVMMLVADALRVALVTTHLPLRDVPDAITRDKVARTIRTVHCALQTDWGIGDPRILVAGLNPHAGEGGHLGREEIEVIAPVLAECRAAGIRLEGPLPADTLFTPGTLQGADAVIAMYHDQGLPVLKHAGFGRAVNVTLGLPFVRTSVDHGTALDLAGTGAVDAGSLGEAIQLAHEMAARRAPGRAVPRL